MKRKMKLAVFAFASAALLVSCVKDNGVVETSFQISAATEDNKIVVTVEPSEASAVYSIGIIMEDDWNRIGGEQGLKAYADSLIASGTETVSGQGIGRYEDLYWQTKYYVFAAQVNDGHVVGTPEYKEANIYRPYVEFDAGDLIIAPASVSDNGMYIVGNYYDGISRNSYIMMSAVILCLLSAESVSMMLQMTVRHMALPVSIPLYGRVVRSLRSGLSEA